MPSPRGEQQLYYVGVRDTILSGEPAFIGTEDAVAVMAILETSFAAGRSGQVLPIPLTAEEVAAFG